MYFWLSVMLKLKLAANFNMTTKNYFVVDCIHNIVFIDFFLWMDEEEHFHLFYLYLHKYEIISQFTRLFFFFYLLIINESSLTKESSIIDDQWGFVQWVDRQ
jgi:hypothetical protein